MIIILSVCLRLSCEFIKEKYVDLESLILLI